MKFNWPGRPKPVEKSIVQQVLEAPATFNRATRRAVGLTGRLWRWDLNANPETRRTYLPRYIRRHYDAAIMRTDPMPSLTRRQRRHRARITRIYTRNMA